MTLLGLDLNASRVRAVRGRLGEYPHTISLEADRADLPLAILADGKEFHIGGAALRQARRLPHLVLRHFLAQLGEALPAQRSWSARHRKHDAREGLKAFCRAIEPCWSKSSGLVLAAPSYLNPNQLDQLMLLLDEARVPWIGSVATPLAAALAAYAEQAWKGSALFLDVDEHALTLTTITAAEDQAQIADTRHFPGLGLEVWKERLLNAVAEVCILDNRWDPRADADAEQGLYDQLEALLETCLAGQMARLTLKTATRFHHFVVPAEESVAQCGDLADHVLAQVKALLAGSRSHGAANLVIVSAVAARLPGLLPALQAGLAEWGPSTPRRETPPPANEEEDFGEDLLEEEEDQVPTLVVQSADAAARGAHSLAGFFTRGDLPRGHLEIAAPLPLPQAPDVGPPRLYFKGQVYFLNGLSFTLGRLPGCDLVFDAQDYPSVAPRHCEIVFDHRLYILRNRSRDGTFVNDVAALQPVTLRAGDWIRLGPDGPMLRFLGQTDPLRLVTTA